MMCEDENGGKKEVTQDKEIGLSLEGLEGK